MQYTKDFLIDAFLSRYIMGGAVSLEDIEKMEISAHKLYDRVGRDEFRKYASLDAEAIREYKKCT